MPYVLNLTPERFGPITFYESDNYPAGIFLAFQQIDGACLSNTIQGHEYTDNTVQET